MRRARLFAVALAVSAFVSAEGCASGGGGARRTETLRPPAEAPYRPTTAFADLPAEGLREPASKGNGARLLRQSLETVPFCSLMRNIDGLTPPKPGDLDALESYAQRYYNQLATFDPRAKIQNPSGTVRQQVAPPAGMVDAIATERAETYAFLTRLKFAAQQRTAHQPASAVRARVDDAVVRFASGPYAAADRLLSTLRPKACPEGA